MLQTHKTYGIAIIIWTLFLVSTKGDYIVQVRPLRYTNEGLSDISYCCSCEYYWIWGWIWGCTSYKDCDNRFEFCLRQDGTSHDASDCYDTGYLCGNDYRFLSPNIASGIPNPMSFFVSGKWPGTVQLLITVFDGSSENEIYHQRDININCSPDSGWLTELGNFGSRGHRGTIEIEYKVVCAPNYYGGSCETYSNCNPRDDHLGHYTCGSSGEKVCRNGWTNTSNNCRSRACLQHYYGDDCDVYCKPHDNHLGHYLCDSDGVKVCIDGWTGSSLNCTVLQKPNIKANCTSKPCHRGVCKDTVNGYICICPTGFNGTNCENNGNDCARDDLCQNGGTCVDGVDSYSCKCAPGFTGDKCENKIADCTHQFHFTICKNGGTMTCVDGGVNSGYTCSCVLGFAGTNCETNINDCNSDNLCQNGGTCQDRVNGYSCDCATGFTGDNCETNINNCTSDDLCQNGGTCEDLVDDFKCICEPGWEGKMCHINSVSRCQNGGAQCNTKCGFAAPNSCCDRDEVPSTLEECSTESPRRGQPFYKGQTNQIYIVPKVSFVWRFHNGHTLELADLVIVLKTVDWYSLGIQLDIAKTKLDEIDQQFPQRQIDRKRYDMLGYWLDKEVKATWEVIIKALERLGGYEGVIRTINCSNKG